MELEPVKRATACLYRLSPAIAGSFFIFDVCPWGLRPRLYAYACFAGSEDQLQRELNIPRAAATEKRIPDTDVRRDGDRQETFPDARVRIDRRCNVGGEAR